MPVSQEMILMLTTLGLLVTFSCLHIAALLVIGIFVTDGECMSFGGAVLAATTAAVMVAVSNYFWRMRRVVRWVTGTPEEEDTLWVPVDDASEGSDHED